MSDGVSCKNICWIKINGGQIHTLWTYSGWNINTIQYKNVKIENTPHLAAYTLSLINNSASVERVFSELKIFCTTKKGQFQVY